MTTYHLLIWLDWLRQQPFVRDTWPLWPAAILIAIVIIGYKIRDWRHR